MANFGMMATGKEKLQSVAVSLLNEILNEDSQIFTEIIIQEHVNTVDH